MVRTLVLALRSQAESTFALTGVLLTILDPMADEVAAPVVPGPAERMVAGPAEVMGSRPPIDPALCSHPIESRVLMAEMGNQSAWVCHACGTGGGA